MVGVLTLFGEIDLQSVLKKVFMQNDLIFITENCNTCVQLLDRAGEHYKESDVIIIAATAINMDVFPDVVSEIRELDSRMRIILILNGNKEQYLETQLIEFEEKRIDILYDDNGFDTQDLIELVKQGKLSKHKPKEQKKHTPIKGFKQISGFPGKSEKESVSEDNEQDVSWDISEDLNKNPIDDTKKNLKPEIKESFSQPTGTYVIGIFGVAHGSGTTTACINLAKYFALHGYTTKLADLSGTEALALVKIKDVEIGFGQNELDEFKNDANALIIDFGTPYDITPKGDNFKISYGYSPENIREFNKCNIKIIMGFSDKWNIGKMKFFLNNEQWREIIDDSFIFLVAGDAKKLKAEYPDINIMNRDDDYKDEIFQVIKEDE